METTRIKMKIGEFEFEAEGPAETVQEQLASFSELISKMPSTPAKEAPSELTQPPLNQHIPEIFPRVPLEKIMHASGRVVSLTALPASVEDAALLIMLGQKDMRENISVTGQEIGDGLEQSGRRVQRVDRILEKAIGDTFVIKTGFKRSTRYRLSNLGLSKALEVARDLIATVP